ncbi:MAG: hypothetical protein PHT94_00845 [Candidatus Nanoarchaeia archaeon]|nr:hypothetical protein [Candidatus Nanoarchaeia archaeon]
MYNSDFGAIKIRREEIIIIPMPFENLTSFNSEIKYKELTLYYDDEKKMYVIEFYEYDNVKILKEHFESIDIDGSNIFKPRILKNLNYSEQILEKLKEFKTSYIFKTNRTLLGYDHYDFLHFKNYSHYVKFLTTKPITIWEICKEFQGIKGDDDNYAICDY